MELTKEHFDKVISGLVTKKDAEALVTKKDAEALVTKKDAEATEKRIIARIAAAQDELARITSGGFDDVLERLDVRERVQKLEKQMIELKTALHLS